LFSTEAAARPILLENNGELFLLERMESEENTLTPEAVAKSRDGIRKAAGSWKNIGTETFKAYINPRHPHDKGSIADPVQM
jgi:hypothetical protein